MRFVLLGLMILVTLAQGVLVMRRYHSEQLVARARQDAQRLANLTLEVFRGQEPPAGVSFWQAIGRSEPINDPWGQAYRMDIFPGDPWREFIWVSAGPDGQFGNGDDVKARVPFKRGAAHDLTRPEIDPAGSAGSVEAR